ncbi:MFS transporter, partial [Bacillus sp. S34]|nr:MFS transporter [Bacillus sp. S34]
MQFLVALDAALLNVALPSIATDLGFTATGLQWVVTAYMLAFAGLLLLGGRLGDLYGRRRVVLVGLAV